MKKPLIAIIVTITFCALVCCFLSVFAVRSLQATSTNTQLTTNPTANGNQPYASSFIFEGQEPIEYELEYPAGWDVESQPEEGCGPVFYSEQGEVATLCLFGTADGAEAEALRIREENKDNAATIAARYAGEYKAWEVTYEDGSLSGETAVADVVHEIIINKNLTPNNPSVDVSGKKNYEYPVFSYRAPKSLSQLEQMQAIAVFTTKLKFDVK